MRFQLQRYRIYLLVRYRRYRQHRWSVFTTETTDTEIEWGADFFGFGVSTVFGEVWEWDVNGSSHTGTHVGWAGSDDTEILRFSATTWNEFFDNIDGSLKAVEDIVDFGRFFHGHNSQVIFFTNPDDETFVSGEVATATVWPVASNTSIDQERISRHIFEHDVGFYEFVISFIRDMAFVAWGKRN